MTSLCLALFALVWRAPTSLRANTVMVRARAQLFYATLGSTARHGVQPEMTSSPSSCEDCVRLRNASGLSRACAVSTNLSFAALCARRRRSSTVGSRGSRNDALRPRFHGPRGLIWSVPAALVSGRDTARQAPRRSRQPKLTGKARGNNPSPSRTGCPRNLHLRAASFRRRILPLRDYHGRFYSKI